MNKLTAVAEHKYTFRLTGRDIAAIILGLEEIQHKLAKPVELKIMEQLEKQVKK